MSQNIMVINAQMGKALFLTFPEARLQVLRSARAPRTRLAPGGLQGRAAGSLRLAGFLRRGATFAVPASVPAQSRLFVVFPRSDVLIITYLEKLTSIFCSQRYGKQPSSGAAGGLSQRRSRLYRIRKLSES